MECCCCCRPDRCCEKCRKCGPFIQPAPPIQPPVVYTNPCLGCPYNGQPYWSIISPCQSCPRRYGTVTATWTITCNIE
jgi:hypothetical protein